VAVCGDDQPQHVSEFVSASLLVRACVRAVGTYQLAEMAPRSRGLDSRKDRMRTMRSVGRASNQRNTPRFSAFMRPSVIG
jgi:hypothetical protein